MVVPRRFNPKIEIVVGLLLAMAVTALFILAGIARLLLTRTACLLITVTGAGLALLNLGLLILAEGEPFIWDCQGQLTLFFFFGCLLIAFGQVVVPALAAKRKSPNSFKQNQSTSCPA